MCVNPPLPPQPDIAPLPDITKVKVADEKTVEGVSSLILLGNAFMWFPYPPQLRVGVSPPLEEEVVIIMTAILILRRGQGLSKRTGVPGIGTASTIAVTLRTFARVAAIDHVH